MIGGLILTAQAWGLAFGDWSKTPLGRFVLRALAGLAVLAAVTVGILLLRAHWIGVGVDQEKAAAAKRLEKGEKHVAVVEKKSDAITSEVATDLAKAKTEIQWRTRVQIKEIPRYVTVESDRACVVGVGALRLHDHAFAGLPGLPEAASGPVEADSGVPLSALVADDVAFAGVAYDWRAEALGWRTWYRRQAELYAAEIKPTPSP
jgi:hypothetical protein